MAKVAPQPWHPADYEAADVSAIQAIARGEANEGQQQRALRWIVENLCGTYDATFYADSVRNSDFAQGKRHVGQQIVKLTKLPLAVIAAQEAVKKRK